MEARFHKGPCTLTAIGKEGVMIVRRCHAGSLTLIGQTDHSRFVGQLAAH
jgi:hypothetical protein